MDKILLKKWLGEDGMRPELAIKAFYTSLDVIPPFVAIDLGANNGFHSTNIALIHKSAQVYAVEANSETYIELLSQIKKRGLGNNIFPINAAVQDNPNIKTIKFNNSSSHPGRSGILPFWFAIPQKKTGVIYSKPVEVIATTVDSICCNRNISKLDFIKADLEGGEFKAFQGALETLRTLRPIVVFERAIEAEKQYGYHKEDWFKLFASCDYTLVTFFGEVMTNSEYYDYWYFYAVPNEKVEIVKDLIFKSVVFENE